MSERGWPFGDSKMHRLIRRHDWAATPLGPIRRWPARLKHAVEIMLASPYPVVVLWGAEAIQLYNDQELALLGNRHPAPLGRPVIETWPDISNQIAVAQKILRGAGTVEYVDQRFDVVDADGEIQSRWLTGGWAAIRDGDGTILGVFAANIDTSSRVRAEEAVRRSEARHAYLLSLGDALRPLGDAVALQQEASRLLRERLRADRVTYWEAADTGYDIAASAESLRHGLPSAIGRPLRFADYDPETAEVFRRGAPAGRDDVDAVEGLTPEQRAAFARVGTRAYYVWPLVKSERFVACLAAYVSSPHRWTADEIELIRETAERTWAAVERARAERALRESDERLHALMDSADESVAIIDRDWRFSYCNPAAHRLLVQNGLDPDPRLGQFVWDAFPTRVRAPLAAAIRSTMERRKSARAEFAFPFGGGREFRARIFPMHDGGVSVFLTDVTERNAVERQARDNAERQDYLLRLNDALRPLSDPEVIKDAAARVLGVHLRANRVGYSEALADGERVEITRQFTDGLDPIEGIHSLKDYGAGFASAIVVGRRSIRTDMAHESYLTDAEKKGVRSLQIGAAVSLPLMKAGRLAAILFVHSCEARTWTPLELFLMQETVERTWDAVQLARAERALQQSEARLAMVLDSIDEGVEIVDRDGRIAYRNPALRDLLVRNGLAPDHGVSQYVWDAFPERAGLPVEAKFFTAMKQRERSIVKVVDPRSGHEFRARLFPMPNGGISMFLRDVTERNAVERQARDNAERQAYLLRLSDALRPLSDPEVIKETAARVLGQHLGANRVGYAEASSDGEHIEITRMFADGVDTMEGVYRYGDFAAEGITAARAGRILVRNDVAREASLTAAEKERVRLRQVGAVVSLPILKSGSLAAILLVHAREPRTWTSLELALMQETVERIWDAVQRARAERALAESEARFRLFADASQDLLWIRNAETRRYEFFSSGFRKVFGDFLNPQPGGLDDYLEFVHLDDLDAVRSSIARVIQGEPGAVHFRMVAPGAGGDIIWIRSAAFPIRDAAGRLTHIGGIAQNATEEHRAAERMRVMIDELQHRTRNLLAVVRSIAEQTMAETGPTPAFQETFGERLFALSRAQGLLSCADEAPITIEALVRMELDALAAAGALAARIRLAGPPVRVRNSQVQTLALALHELATNARKYGALSGKDGRLELAWSVREAREQGRRLVLEWIETTEGLGGAAVETLKGGYGRTLIERGLPYALGAETSYAIGESGVRCVIDLPLDRMED